MKKAFGTVILIILLCGYALGQRSIRPDGTREVIINSGDTIVVANILLDGKKVKTNIRRTYYWYMREKICHNTGDYSGKLLDGRYQVFIRDKMILSGTYDKGLRCGKWIEWDLKGSVTKITVYKKGVPFSYEEKRGLSKRILFRGKKDPKPDVVSKEKGQKHQRQRDRHSKQ